jgi:hypothetical protein
VVEDACRGIDVGGSMHATRQVLSDLVVKLLDVDCLG